jgi:hypothetical protein
LGEVEWGGMGWGGWGGGVIQGVTWICSTQGQLCGSNPELSSMRMIGEWPPISAEKRGLCGCNTSAASRSKRLVNGISALLLDRYPVKMWGHCKGRERSNLQMDCWE